MGPSRIGLTAGRAGTGRGIPGRPVMLYRGPVTFSARGVTACWHPGPARLRHLEGNAADCL